MHHVASIKQINNFIYDIVLQKEKKRFVFLPFSDYKDSSLYNTVSVEINHIFVTDIIIIAWGKKQ